jgi:hypothetical protein
MSSSFLMKDEASAGIILSHNVLKKKKRKKEK